ncbi:helix-turn-helix domain-containing protein [Hyphomicrobium sp.]|uniref:winged helix-turn-helix domain-containing protein n=1 Tax=Hyphomicrobium sp. TaxID=82 RepID=UPI0025C6462B|nr:helix-turn-helix domain-containing protein [Hyphomicrobium sp.]MCC7252425.1 winged helix-turn-helix domain-containing protein [Hyphomicrobium sp.]
MEQRRYGDLVFDKTLLFAERGKSEQLRFTRYERALLKLFMQNPNRPLSRAHILDAITHTGSDISDRNVDFLVNRLRAKLGDSARAPRFIATQYGEGYVWIAKQEESVSAFVVIGPCYGMRHEPTAARAGPMLAGLAKALDAVTGQKHGIVIKPDWSSDANTSGSVSYSLDASLHEDIGRLHGAFVLRDGRSGQILQAFRMALASAPQDNEIRALATCIKDAIWAHRALPSPSPLAPVDRPLELRMHDAALLLSRAPESWQEAGAQIERARAANPDDPALAIMRGLALYASLIQVPRPAEEWEAIEAEIEDLVLGSLSAIQDNPLLVLGAAKLLFFIDRGHFELADRLAEEAFERSTAFAAAFATRAQIRMYQGDFVEARLLYDKAIELAEPGSEFLVYLKVLKTTLALAANDRAMVDVLGAELYAINPAILAKIGLFIVDPEAQKLPDHLEALLASFGEARAHQIILFLYNVSARHFHAAKHRENVMRGLITHMIRHYGEGIVPDLVGRGLRG